MPKRYFKTINSRNSEVFDKKVRKALDEGWVPLYETFQASIGGKDDSNELYAIMIYIDVEQ